MLPDRVSNPGPLTYESGILPIALRGPAHSFEGSLYLKKIIPTFVPSRGLQLYYYPFSQIFSHNVLIYANMTFRVKVVINSCRPRQSMAIIDGIARSVNVGRYAKILVSDL